MNLDARIRRQVRQMAKYSKRVTRGLPDYTNLKPIVCKRRTMRLESLSRVIITSDLGILRAADLANALQ